MFNRIKTTAKMPSKNPNVLELNLMLLLFENVGFIIQLPTLISLFSFLASLDTKIGITASIIKNNTKINICENIKYLPRLHILIYYIPF